MGENMKAGPYRAEFGAIHHEDAPGHLFTVSPPVHAPLVVDALNRRALQAQPHAAVDQDELLEAAQSLAQIPDQGDKITVLSRDASERIEEATQVLVRASYRLGQPHAGGVEALTYGERILLEGFRAEVAKMDAEGWPDYATWYGDMSGGAWRLLARLIATPPAHPEPVAKAWVMRDWAARKIDVTLSPEVRNSWARRGAKIEPLYAHPAPADRDGGGEAKVEAAFRAGFEAGEDRAAPTNGHNPGPETPTPNETDAWIAYRATLEPDHGE